MNELPLVIRPAVVGDLAELTAIHNWYSEHTVATFAEHASSVSDRMAWFERFSCHPFELLVAEIAGQVAGYAAAGPYRSHPAFSRTVETSVYLERSRRGHGLGGKLYDVLLADLGQTEVHSAVAGVALPNDASIALHRSRGFREVGTFTEYAVVRGERVSSTWFERLLTA